jgi:magnesium chelatase subunit D
MKHFNTLYPFSAIVGQERMKKALLLNAINPKIGGVLIKGEKGTAKSTAVRALADLLPEIEVVRDCVFGCNPDEHNEMCEQCLEKSDPEIEIRKMKVVNLPIGSTEDRVLGTLDIEHAIKKGEKKFEPGILAEAHRNILYVDEVNLLDDHIVDVLLDAAAMGVNIIEREGVSYSHPSSFILVGTMNPEEGELRPQLLDRFGLCADIEGINEAQARVEIIKRRMEYEKDPEGFANDWRNKETEIRDAIVMAKELLPGIKIEDEMLRLIAHICIDMAVDGHRADIAMMKTAATIAAYHQRNEVTEGDVKEAAELVLPHRMRRKPFSDQKMEKEKLDQSMQKHKEEKHKQKQREQDHNQEQNPHDPVPDASSETFFEEGEPFKVNQTVMKNAARDSTRRNGSGRRSKTITGEGRHVKSIIPAGKVTDLAFEATFRAAAPHQMNRDKGELAIRIENPDLREKLREKKIGNTLLFVVDASGSMGARARMTAAKGAVLSLLIDAYQKRDKVGLVAFKGNNAEVLLPPTSSVELARTYLQSLPTGGKTPLAQGLVRGFEVLSKEKELNKNVIPLLILLSDGKANVSMGSGKPVEEAKQIAALIKASGIRSLVIDAEQTFIGFGFAREISNELGATYLKLEELQAQDIVDGIRDIGM